MRTTVIVMTTLLAGLCRPVSGASQSPERPLIELNVHAGGARFLAVDRDREAGLLVGARGIVDARNGWSFGGSFDALLLDQATAYLFSLGVERALTASSQVRPFFGVGLGGMTVDVTGDARGDLSRGPEPLVPIVGGVRWYPGPGSRWVFRAEVRDDIVFRDDEDDDGAVPLTEVSSVAGSEGTVDHNWEISAGVSLFVGPIVR